MKKFLTIFISAILLFTAIYFSFLYFATFSEGVRSGELIKISKKGMLIKTWEGEISQGISGAQIFKFSVESKNKQVIEDLKNFQGNYVKVEYIERFKNLFWLGDTKYFITKVTPADSPHFQSKPNKNE